MTEPAPKSSKKPPPMSRSSARSGEHPAIKAYRAKLESVSERTNAATDTLNDAIDEALTRLKTPVPESGPSE